MSLKLATQHTLPQVPLLVLMGSPQCEMIAFFTGFDTFTYRTVP